MVKEMFRTLLGVFGLVIALLLVVTVDSNGAFLLDLLIFIVLTIWIMLKEREQNGPKKLTGWIAAILVEIVLNFIFFLVLGYVISVLWHLIVPLMVQTWPTNLSIANSMLLVLYFYFMEDVDDFLYDHLDG